MNNYFQTIYKILFEPKEAFNELKDYASTSTALFTLTWVNLILISIKYVFTGDFFNIISYIFMLIFYLISTYISWFVLGLFFEYIAKIYDKSGRLKNLLFLSSFSAIPWVLLAPFELLKELGDAGYFSSCILELVIYFWTIFLYCKALQTAYDLKFSRSIMLIFLPFLSSFFAFLWIIGFFTKLSYIFTV